MHTDEISGTGNHTTALFWEYDTRLGRRWNLDPKPQVFISDYAVLGNNPIINTDILGDKFTDSAKKGADNLKNQANVYINANKANIKRLKRFKGNHRDEIKALRNRNREFKKVIRELNHLEKSKQLYDIREISNNEHTAKTWFNPINGAITLDVPSLDDYQSLANEFTHAYQFDKGRLSIDQYGRGMLFDANDDFQSTKRDLLFSGDNEFDSYTINDWLSDYGMKISYYDNNGNLISSSYTIPTKKITIRSKDENGVRYKMRFKQMIKKYNASTVSYEVIKGWSKHTKYLPLKK